MFKQTATRDPQDQTLPNWITTSIGNLAKIGLVTPKGALFASKSIYQHGPNLMVLLEFASVNAPNRRTLNEQLTYRQAYQVAMSLAHYLNKKLAHKTIKNTRFKANPKVALLCSNHLTSVLALFAVARLGADITLLNTDMSQRQIGNIIEQQRYDMIICDDNVLCDEDLSSILPTITKDNSPIIISKAELDNVINLESQTDKSKTRKQEKRQSTHKLKRHVSGKINVLTGGTSGRIKLAKREPSVVAMLMPFVALLNKVELAKYQSVYIAVPFYHGYGLASLIIAVLLSARLFTSDKFDTVTASQLIEDHQIEALILVPTMLSRLLARDIQLKEQSRVNNDDKSYPSLFSSVKRIVSGGAKLDASLVKQTLAHTGDTLFNLYGTSETGFGIIATPKDLHRYPDSIGKAIRGVRWQINPLSLQSSSKQKIGVLALGTAWSMDSPIVTEATNGKGFISTGDLAYANKEGYLFLKDRADDMIVSGGENVYPNDIENALKQHPQVSQVAVISVNNDEFGKRLVAFVSLKALDNQQDDVTTLESVEQPQQIKVWLKPRLARYQMPQQVVMIDKLPMTKTGKVSQQRLKAYLD